jgi:predicted dienelactone hydrolase
LGRGARNGSAAKGPFPLVLMSHGYPGNRYLMAPLAEVIASHGFVVASIDHAGSTYADQLPLASTLYHRPLDLRFVLDRLGGPSAPLEGVIDATRTGVIGYSMGGYGALVFAGAAIAPEAVNHAVAPAGGLLARHAEGSAELAALTDERIAAVIAFGPYGNNAGIWRAEGLAQMTRPLLVIAGDHDDTSGYEAMRGIWAGCSHPERHLLTFYNAGHNAGAPMPAPSESYAMSSTLGWPPFEHYADAVWDSVRMNNIAAHACVAMLSAHLMGDTETGARLAELGALAGISLESA